MTWKPDYAVVASLKSYLRISDTVDDVFLALWVTTSSRNVDDFCGRQFGQVAAPEAREYTAEWDRPSGRWVYEIDDLPTTVGFTVATTDTVPVTLLATDYKLGPVNALKTGKVYERLTTSSYAGPLTMTGSWGWTSVPSAVPTGLYLQAARLAARRDSPFGIAGSPSEGSELRLLAQLDPDFRTSLKPYVRNWWAA